MEIENRLEHLFFSIYISFASIFIILYIPFYPYLFSVFIKAVPLASILIFTLIVKRGRVRTYLALGLLLFLCGDVLFDLDPSRYFIFGLGCFLLAHIFYMILFLRDFRYRAKSLPVIAGVTVYGLAMAWLLRNADPERIIPVMVYLVVVSLMTMSAAIYSAGRAWKGANLVVIGAAVFMLSASVIAVNQFLLLIPNTPMISLSLYWTAQLLIVRGIQISD